MHMRALFEGERVPSWDGEGTRCFRCSAEPVSKRLYRCTEPMREEWTACLTCALSGARPKPRPDRSRRS
jgi:hypothetical protein